MIIVEGPDGAGKTTLVQHLAQKYDIPVAAKVVDSDTNPIYQDLKYWVERNVSKGLQWELFDRHRLISEPIYQSAMARGPAPGFDDLQWFTGRMIDFTRIHPFIIFALPSYETVMMNLHDDDKNQSVVNCMDLIYPAYVAAAAGSIARGQAVHFDYNQDPDYDRVDMLFDLWVKNNHVRLARNTAKKVSASDGQA